MEGQKLVILINGKGGSGKDTICQILNRHYPTTVVSTITKVKSAARLIFGWTGSKSEEDRKFLSDLKDLWTAYNDGPFHYAYKAYKDFVEKPINSYNEILVIHVREPEEIDKLRRAISNDGLARCTTMLVMSNRTENQEYGNRADDGVNDYAYEYVYHNDGAIEKLDDDFMWFFNTVMVPSWQKSH